MLDYIPFTKGQEQDQKIISGGGGSSAAVLKNQKYTLKFLQNKQNYSKINKVKDYQSLLNSPEQITTRSLDIQQFELYFNKDGNINNAKGGKAQFLIAKKFHEKESKQLQLLQQFKVENINLSQDVEHNRKLEYALNRSKFNQSKSIGDGYRSQESFAVIKKMTRYQEMKQSSQQYIEITKEDTDQNIEQTVSSIKGEDQPQDQVSYENAVSIEPDENEEEEEQQLLQEQQDNTDFQPINESCVQSIQSGNPQPAVNNEISLFLHDDDEDQYEEQEKVESPGVNEKNKKGKQQKKPRSEKQVHLQQQLASINQSINSQKGNQSIQSQIINQSMQSAKKSTATKSNKISRQQSQLSISDIDRVEQIISQNANEVDQAEEIQREKMRQHMRQIEEKIQQTKQRQEQFTYQPEDYQDMSGEYLKVKKQEQQQQQQQQQQQVQQQIISTPQQQQNIKKQPKQESKQQQNKTKPVVISQKKPEVTTQSNLDVSLKLAQAQEISQNQLPGEKSAVQSNRQSMKSIQLENSVVHQSVKELEEQHSRQEILNSAVKQGNSQIDIDPLTNIENKLKEMEDRGQFEIKVEKKIDFADFLLTTINVFDAKFDSYKIYKKEIKTAEPPNHFGEEEQTLFVKMKAWDDQNKGNSRLISAVAEIVRGIQTRFTSDANLSDLESKTQKSIDSDWD